MDDRSLSALTASCVILGAVKVIYACNPGEYASYIGFCLPLQTFPNPTVCPTDPVSPPPSGAPSCQYHNGWWYVNVGGSDFYSHSCLRYGGGSPYIAKINGYFSLCQIDGAEAACVTRLEWAGCDYSISGNDKTTATTDAEAITSSSPTTTTPLRDPSTIYPSSFPLTFTSPLSTTITPREPSTIKSTNILPVSSLQSTEVEKFSTAKFILSTHPSIRTAPSTDGTMITATGNLNSGTQYFESTRSTVLMNSGQSSTTGGIDTTPTDEIIHTTGPTETATDDPLNHPIVSTQYAFILTQTSLASKTAHSTNNNTLQIYSSNPLSTKLPVYKPTKTWDKSSIARTIASLLSDDVSSSNNHHISSTTDMVSSSPAENTYLKWNSWTSWSVCSKTCGTGLQYRFRICQPNSHASECKQIPTESYGRIGVQFNKTICNTETCSFWLSWGSWSLCPDFCGTHSQSSRERLCMATDGTGTQCVGEGTETRRCLFNACLSSGTKTEQSSEAPAIAVFLTQIHWTESDHTTSSKAIGTLGVAFFLALAVSVIALDCMRCFISSAERKGKGEGQL